MITILALMAALCGGARAQSSFRPNHEEINFMYGIPSISGYALGIVDALVGLGSELTGSFTVEYFRYNNSARLAYGAAGTYECIFLREDEDDGSTEKFSQNFFSLMPSAKLIWFNTKHFGMYTKVAAGVQLIVDNSVPEDMFSALFAFQVNPVCLEAGGDRFRGFGEFGWGMQGLFHIGVRYNF